MKSKLLALALGLSFSLSALADPVLSLPAGPLFVKFNGAEQIAAGVDATGAAYNTGYANEISWGVFVISNIDKGTVVTPNVQIQDNTLPSANFFTNGSHNAQVTGIFYGIEQGSPATAANPLPGAMGFLDLYWRDLNIYTATDVGAVSLIPGAVGVRSTQSTAAGFTDGTLLAHIVFTAGIDPLNGGVTVSGTLLPTALADGKTGVSDFFANIDAAAGGAWASQLDANYFTTAFGAADLKFKNSYNQLTPWDGAQSATGGVFGAKLDDPAQAFAIPEPSVLALMGLAMLGMGIVRRRRNG